VRRVSLVRWCSRVVLSATLALAAGCASLLPKSPAPPALFVLEGLPALLPGAPPIGSTGPTLVVQATQAAAGFDSARIVYTRKPHQLETFAHSEWVDTPARMLTPLIVAALGRSAAFRAVVVAPSAAAGDLRLETELLRLQHEFGGSPSRVHLALRATLTDSATRRVLARQDFDLVADAPTEDAYGGVRAANQATAVLLQTLVTFCDDAARPWQPGSGRAGMGSIAP
jgi:cholesterol transport system auxiliary component